MFVGIARVVLRLPGARSLKDRRRVVKSYKDRLKARLPIVVAELGDGESHQMATLGLCTVSGELGQSEAIIHKALGMARSLADALVVDARHEVIPFGVGGSALGGGIEDALLDQALNEKYEGD